MRKISSEALCRHVELLLGYEAAQRLLVKEVQRELDSVADYVIFEGVVKGKIGSLLDLCYLFAGCHEVVRVAAKDLSIDEGVFLCSIGQFFPSLAADWVKDIFFLKTEMLLP